jgi:carbonic anhydrase
MKDPINNRFEEDSEMRLIEAIKRGASMEEIAQLREPVAESPMEAIHALRAGNARFFNGTSQLEVMSPLERRAQVLSQTPFAVVVGCSDSRVPIENVFDQGAGNLFVIRVAGSVIGQSCLGSIEFAIHHLKIHLIIVLGHEGCGAVNTAMLDESKWAGEPANLRSMLARIRPAVQSIPHIRDAKARMREAVIANVRQQVHVVQQNESVLDAKARDQVAVIGGYYEISSGAVDFLITEDELRL